MLIPPTVTEVNFDELTLEGMAISLAVSTASAVQDGPPVGSTTTVTACVPVTVADLATLGHELLPNTTTTSCPGSPHPTQVRVLFSVGPSHTVGVVGTDDRRAPPDVGG